VQGLMMSMHRTWFAEGRAQAKDGRETAAPAPAVASGEVAHRRRGGKQIDLDLLFFHERT